MLICQTAENITQLGGNPKKGFLIGGISAGANFSAILSHMYRDDKLSPPLTGVYLSIPACMAADLCPEKYKPYWLSREQNIAAPILNNDSMQLFESMSRPLPSVKSKLMSSSSRTLSTRSQIHMANTNALPFPRRPPIHIFPDLRHGSSTRRSIDLRGDIEGREWGQDES